VTLFHITAGDPWPEEPALLDKDGTVNWKVATFHMAYEISVGWVVLQVTHCSCMDTTKTIEFCCGHHHWMYFLQVSVAALLDNFISASAEMELDEKLEQAKACIRDRLELNPMEPLLLKLAREFTDSQDLSDRLLKLYKVSRTILFSCPSLRHAG
jgi:hypothetical protein